MLLIEIKKNTFSIVFLLGALLVAGFTFLSLSPETKYFYTKPLSFGEHTYFSLKDDIMCLVKEKYSFV